MSNTVHPIFEPVIAAARGAAEGEQPAAYTPGPLDWVTVGAETNGHVYLIDANNRKIASLWGKPAEKIANANLYSAAPDMLAALRSARDCILDNPRTPNAFKADALRAIDAAIARATKG